MIIPLLKGLRLTLARFFEADHNPVSGGKEDASAEVERHPLFRQGRER